MLKKSLRYSFRKGLPEKYFNTKYFSLRYRKSEDNKFHCAIVVRKAVDKKSTARHYLKRRFEEELKDVLKEYNLPYDLVFFLKKELQQSNFVNIKDEIQKALDNLK